MRKTPFCEAGIEKRLVIAVTTGYILFKYNIQCLTFASFLVPAPGSNRDIGLIGNPVQTGSCPRNCKSVIR